MFSHTVSLWRLGAALALSLTLTAASAPAALAPQAIDTEPFERLGQRLVELADQRAGPSANAADTTTTRLEALHERIRFGAFDLWAPLVTLDAKGREAPGARAKDLVDRGRRLLALQRYWLEREDPSEPTHAAARAALPQIETWWASFKALPHAPPSEDAQSALAALQAHFGLPMRSGRRLTMIFAPTRAQYLAVVGARGLLSGRMRRHIWTAVDLTAPFTSLRDGSSVFASTWALGREGAGLLDDGGMSKPEQEQWFTHAAAHQLVFWLVPTAPPWFVEALSIDATLAVCGADETNCTGCREIENIPAWWLGGLEALSLLSREKGPFRGASATRFAKPLRAAAREGGFTILDLERERPAEVLHALILGPNAPTPAEAVHGGLGVRKGFAEFHRAYTVAFVGYLQQEFPEPFRRLLSALRRVPYRAVPDSTALHTLVREHFELTLGESTDPALDLEARFRAWLTR